MSKIKIRLSHGIYRVEIDNRFLRWLFFKLYKLDIREDLEQMQAEEEFLENIRGGKS